MEDIANEFVEHRQEARLSAENRSESRLRYSWPVWFAENYNDILAQGQMVDISSGGAAFTCYADKCPYPGQEVTTRFSVPNHSNEDPFALENFVRNGRICRVDEISPYVRRVAIQFAEPLPFKPAEQQEELENSPLKVTVGEAIEEMVESVASVGMEMAEK